MIRIAWNGLTLGGDPFRLDKLIGWLELPGAEYATAPAATGHGLSPSPGRQAPRFITAGGTFGSAQQRDAAFTLARVAMVPKSSADASLNDLTVTIDGVTGTAHAQLQRFAVELDVKRWASGTLSWVAQWRCPDPRIFGAPVTASAALVTATAGDPLPFTLPHTLPPRPIGGRVTVVNPGSDPEGSNVTVTLTGAQSGSVGVRNITTGALLTYSATLAVGDQLVVDSEVGGRLNGEYRPAVAYSSPAYLLRAQPGVNVYEATGTAAGGSPSISVTVVPASW
jgi:hypothetical protein